MRCDGSGVLNVLLVWPRAARTRPALRCAKLLLRARANWLRSRSGVRLAQLLSCSERHGMDSRTVLCSALLCSSPLRSAPLSTTLSLYCPVHTGRRDVCALYSNSYSYSFRQFVCSHQSELKVK